MSSCTFHLFFVFLFLAVAGCSSSSTGITITGRASGNAYLGDFPTAFIGNAHDGEYDVVMISDDPSDHADSGNGPLQPVIDQPLRQAICIHILWRPSYGAMAKEASITNAIIDWYVFGNSDERNPKVIHYGGAGFVRVYPKEETAKIDIRDGQVQPKLRRGDMRDPLGPAVIAGSFRAIHDDHRVQELLFRIRQQAGETEKPVASGK